MEHVIHVREWCQEMNHTNLDIATMGRLHAFVMMGDATIRTAR